MSGPPGPLPLDPVTRPTPVVEILSNVVSLNSNISTLSSYVNTLGPSSGPSVEQWTALSSLYNTESTTISSVGVAYSTNLILFNSLSSQYITLASGLSLEKQAGYLSTRTNLYFGGSTFASSFNISKTLNVGSNTVGATTLFNAAIGSNNTVSSNFGLATGQLNIFTRLGGVALNYGNNNTGLYSHAEGSSSAVSGSYSHVEGGNNTNAAGRSHAEGYANLIDTTGIAFAHIEGRENIIDVDLEGTHAEGFQTDVLGSYGHAEGTQTSSIGIASHVQGFQTNASAQSSHAEGMNNVISAGGLASHVEGFSTSVIGITQFDVSYSHAEGRQTTANDMATHSEGFQTTAGGLTVNALAAHAEGWGTATCNIAGHAEGRATFANSDYSHSEGICTFATALYAHVEGSNNRVSGEGAHSEGQLNSSIGSYSHTHNIINKALSTASHAHGSNCTAQGFASHSHGFGLGAFGIATHAHGQNAGAGVSSFNAIGNYSHVHGCNTITIGIASMAIGNGTPQANTANYGFIGGQFCTSAGTSNIFNYGYINIINPGYNYQSFLGGFCNGTRAGGAPGISSYGSGNYPGIGGVVLGGYFAIPRQPWAITSASGRYDTNQGTAEMELFNLFGTTSTTNTYCNLIYLERPAFEIDPYRSSLFVYIENTRAFANTYDIQLTGFETATVSTQQGNGVFSANYRFITYYGNASTVVSGFPNTRSIALCDSDGNTIANANTKVLCSITTLNKLSGVPNIELQALISTQSIAAFTNAQSYALLSVRSSADRPINWLTKVKRGTTYFNNNGTNPWRT